MPLTSAFKLSLYLSLGLACTCLAYSESPFLPEIPLFTIVTGGLLVFAYVIEGRWELSLTAANFVGMVLAAMLGVWVAFQFLRPTSDSLLALLPWPTGLLPYLGPLLMVLIPVKLLRPKHLGDYWAMQALNLMAVALGCALAGDALFGVLLICWLAVFVWNLTLFYLYREVGSGGSVVIQQHPMPGVFRVSSRWTMGVVALGLLLFLATPRLTTGRWELPSKARLEVGIAADSQIDLNRTGTLDVNDDIACEIYAEELDGTPKLDLPLTQRWRTMQLIKYEKGRWLRDVLTANIHVMNRIAARPAFDPGNPALRDRTWQQRMPDLGPGRYFVTFRPAAELGSLPLLADPVLWRPQGASPILSEGQKGPLPWNQMPDGTFGILHQRQPISRDYRQVVGSSAETRLGSAMRLARGQTDFLARPPDMPNLRRFTDALLRRLTLEGYLSADVLNSADQFTGLPARNHHEQISLALESYLSTSKDFTYSLDLQRKDKRIDPVEDFLYNVRSGHCERFATALVMMLRSEGIPAQIVLGFKGCEPRGNGWYDIRQSHAHAWVEVLVRRPASEHLLGILAGGSSPVLFLPLNAQAHAMLFASGLAGPASTAYFGGRLLYEPNHYWLTLDPTPTLARETPGLIAGLLGSTQRQGETFFKDFILGYNSQARDKALGAIADWFEEQSDRLSQGELPLPVAVLLAVLALPLIWRFARARLRERRKHRASWAEASKTHARIVPFHARLMEVLGRHGFALRPGDTAREFAADVAHRLEREPATAAVADVPVLAADSYYRVRFGDEEISESDSLTLDDGLNRLEAALAGWRPAADV